MPDLYLLKVISNEPLRTDIYSMMLACPDLAGLVHPGQFLHIKCDTSMLLRRPISVCSADGGNLRIVFEVKGDGTAWLSQRRSGEVLDVLGPLGRHFTYPEGLADLYKKIIVIGGGLGIPPMLYAAQASQRNAVAILGYRDKSRVFMVDEFKEICGEVVIATEDGSLGIHGTVAEPLERLLTIGRYDAVYSCGPYAMQKAVAEICMTHEIPCQVSLEERMGCGVGACRVCACATLQDGERRMSRVCKDGPVFNAKDVDWS